MQSVRFRAIWWRHTEWRWHYGLFKKTFLVVQHRFAWRLSKSQLICHVMVPLADAHRNDKSYTCPVLFLSSRSKWRRSSKTLTRSRWPGCTLNIRPNVTCWKTWGTNTPASLHVPTILIVCKMVWPLTQRDSIGKGKEFTAAYFSCLPFSLFCGFSIFCLILFLISLSNSESGHHHDALVFLFHFDSAPFTHGTCECGRFPVWIWQL